MGIQIADAMSQLRRTLIMCILQMCRDRTGLGMCHKIHRRIDRHDRRITFRGTRHIRRRLRKHDPRLRHAKPFHRLCRTCRHNQCLRVCIRHILRRTDHNTTCNKRHILPGIKHTCQIIHCRIRIGSPHTLDKR